MEKGQVIYNEIDKLCLSSITPEFEKKNCLIVGKLYINYVYMIMNCLVIWDLIYSASVHKKKQASV